MDKTRIEDNRFDGKQFHTSVIFASKFPKPVHFSIKPPTIEGFQCTITPLTAKITPKVSIRTNTSGTYSAGYDFVN